MAVNLKLLHYARQMADVKPAQYSEAVENISKRLLDSKMIKGVAEDIFDSKTLEKEAVKLKNELKEIGVPKNALKSFVESVGDLFKEHMNINGMTVSDAQAKRMQLKKAIKQNEPVKKFLQDVNEHLGKSEAAKNITSTIDSAVKTVQEFLFKQPDLPDFMRMGQELSQEATSKGTLAGIRETLNYLTK